MELYSVLLVDDEEEVIQIIRKKMDWEAMGFRVVGYAHNGVEALEMAEERQPDVVMTDIKMPYMDGLTLSRKLKELYRTVKIIIFSGFDEFEYAKEAVKIEVEEYILKPVNAAELREVFERIRIKLDRELSEKRDADKLREYYLESLPLLQENFYTSLIEGRISEEQIGRHMENYQIRLRGPYFIVAILHISTPEAQTEMPPLLLTVSVKKLAEEQLAESRWNGRTLMYLGDIVIISQLESGDEVRGYTDFMDELCRVAKHLCGARVTAGIGHVCDRILDIRISWQGARRAVSYRVIYGNTRAINIAEIDPQENTDERWEEQAIQQILKRVRMGSREELEKEITGCVRRFPRKDASIQKCQIFIMGLMSEISRFCDNNRMDMNEIYGQGMSASEKGDGNYRLRDAHLIMDIYSRGFEAESPEKLWNWLMDICGRLQEAVRKEHQNVTKSFVTRAEEYVREHYADRNISIETVCRELGVSAAYFSTIFKKETGKTFISYLTDYRMERAVELLMTTDSRTYVIAEKVGYSDPNYFSYVFKKQYNMSPSKYRMGKEKDGGKNQFLFSKKI